MPAATYTCKPEVVEGRFLTETLGAVRMPRAVFLREVDACIQKTMPEHTREAVKKAIWPTAETMPRFPIETFMAPRGCGCIVGELLVAEEAVSREDFASARYAVSVGDELRKLHGTELGNWLYDFGLQVDLHFKMHVRRDMEQVGSYPFQIILIEDEVVA